MTDSLHVHIGRLVVDGVGWGASDREAFRTAVEAELARLLTGDGPRAAYDDSRRQPTVDLAGAPHAAALDVARSVHDQLGRHAADLTGNSR